MNNSFLIYGDPENDSYTLISRVDARLNGWSIKGQKLIHDLKTENLNKATRLFNQYLKNLNK